MDETIPVDLDAVWKAFFDTYLAGFLEFFCPATHALGDWSVPPEALDAELQTLTRDGDVGKVVADRLYKVKRKAGPGDLFLLVHVEVQNQVIGDLADRMWKYHYRIFDAYGQHPVALAVFGDTAPTWRPAEYEFRAGDTRLTYAYAAVKLWDWIDRTAELEALPTPFALAVLAHLQRQRHRADHAALFQWKRRLIRLLYDKGHTPDDFRAVLKLIDNLLKLTPILERQIDEEIRVLEQEKNVELVWPYEQRAEARGEARAEVKWMEAQRAAWMRSVAKMLKNKFGDAGERFAEVALAGFDAAALESVFDAVLAAVTLDDVRTSLANPT